MEYYEDIVYSGIEEFIICLGCKGQDIRKYFATYSLHMRSVTFDLRQNEMKVHPNSA